MANEHLRTAAMNIKRAIQDVRDAQKRLHREIDDYKRKNAKAIDAIHKQIAACERKRYMIHVPPQEKATLSAQEQALLAEITNINRDTELYVQAKDRDIAMYDGQAVEFENLAGHLLALS